MSVGVMILRVNGLRKSHHHLQRESFAPYLLSVNFALQSRLQLIKLHGTFRSLYQHLG